MALLQAITLQKGVKEVELPKLFTYRNKLLPQSQGNSQCAHSVYLGLQDGVWPLPFAHEREGATGQGSSLPCQWGTYLPNLGSPMWGGDVPSKEPNLSTSQEGSCGFDPWGSPTESGSNPSPMHQPIRL